ncbi:MAG: 30S ribosomal protein S17 [Candidatus Omnitrophica bacterium]|nr:30S ribosomal protein S17 [Candidatus Omnitrophota bacterium]
MPKGRILMGRVVSDKMDKTIVIEVARRFQHALYKKQVLQKKKYKAHDAENKAKIGDMVKIVASRPFSKEKRFELLEIVQ